MEPTLLNYEILCRDLINTLVKDVIYSLFFDFVILQLAPIKMN